MEFVCLNEPALILFGRRKILCLTKIKTGRTLEWRGETVDGEYILVRYRSGFLAVGIGETEYDSDDVQVLASADSLIFESSKSPTIEDVMSFLDWAPVEPDSIFE